MRFLALVLLLTSLTAFAQPATKHADAVKLVEVSGAREKIRVALPGLLDEGEKKFAAECTSCTPAFAAEWRKRFGQQLTLDSLMQIFVEEYEAAFTDEDIKGMTDLLAKQAAGAPVEPSPELRARLTTAMPGFMSKVTSRCSEVGSKLGKTIAEQITKEHPDWVKATP